VGRRQALGPHPPHPRAPRPHPPRGRCCLHPGTTPLRPPPPRRALLPTPIQGRARPKPTPNAQPLSYAKVASMGVPKHPPPPQPKSTQPNKQRHQAPAFWLPTRPDTRPCEIYWALQEYNKLQGAITMRPTRNGRHIVIPANETAAMRLTGPLHLHLKEAPITLVRVGAHTQPLQKYVIYDIHAGTPPSIFTGLPGIAKVEQWRNNNGTWTATLHTTCQLAAKLIAGNKAWTVRRYTPTPHRCTRCQAFSHTKRRCTEAKPKCAFCAGEHWSSLCFSELQRGARITQRCANCGGGHKASSPHCPAYRKAQAVLAR
jgi:hypothetical protein